jgi:DNA-3-methyladenine glycosylase II
VTPSPLAPLDSDSFAGHAAQLAASDPVLGAVVAAYGLPAFWRRPATFATLVLLVVEQQVSLASAKAVFDRMAVLLGGAVTPEAILGVTADDLGRVGLTRQKQRYVRLLAEEVAEGRLDLPGLAALPDGEARARLLALTGIGPWTADVYLLSALGRPDMWPVGDRALQVGVAEVLGLSEVPTAVELESLGEPWRPVRAVAARLVWHAYLVRRNRQETTFTTLA